MIPYNNNTISCHYYKEKHHYFVFLCLFIFFFFIISLCVFFFLTEIDTIRFMNLHVYENSPTPFGQSVVKKFFGSSEYYTVGNSCNTANLSTYPPTNLSVSRNHLSYTEASSHTTDSNYFRLPPMWR